MIADLMKTPVPITVPTTSAVVSVSVSPRTSCVRSGMLIRRTEHYHVGRTVQSLPASLNRPFIPFPNGAVDSIV